HAAALRLDARPPARRRLRARRRRQPGVRRHRRHRRHSGAVAGAERDGVARRRLPLAQEVIPHDNHAYAAASASRAPAASGAPCPTTRRGGRTAHNVHCAPRQAAYHRRMSRIIATSRYLALAGVAFGLIAALAAFIWGGLKTILLLIKLAHGEIDGMAVGLVQIMDAFLIAAGLLILAFGLYELFVGEVAELPAWLTIKELDALKGKLAGVIVMVMAV